MSRAALLLVLAWNCAAATVNVCETLDFQDDDHCLPAENILEYRDDVQYCHHALFWKFMQYGMRFPMVRGMLREETGLILPWEYDCTKWQLSDFPYHSIVPSRYVRCHEQEGMQRLKLSVILVNLPIIDEEYTEMIAVYQSVLMAKGSFHMADMGARWGTWGSRAAMFLRKANSMPYSLLYFEPQKAAEGLVNVQTLNGIENYTLVNGLAEQDSLRRWAATLTHIDLIDMDIQSGEETLVPQVMDLLNAKVYRVIMGTHTVEGHNKLRDLLLKEGWKLLNELPMIHNQRCLKKYFHFTHNFPEVIKQGCYYNTTWGPITAYDGALMFDNVKLRPAGHSAQTCTVALGRQLNRTGGITR